MNSSRGIMHGLKELQEQMENCGSCDLCRTRHKVVFGEGSTEPLIMFIGEAPEDTADASFAGAINDKLSSILKYINVTRDEIYVTNSVLCSTPNGRNPRSEELESCKWRLDLQIGLLKPRLIILLGKIATEQLKNNKVKGALSQFFVENLKDHKDGWLRYCVGDHEAKVMVSYHPKYHLRSPKRAYKITLPHWTKIKNWVENERQTR